ncbi:MAG: TetR/AcrR family transcriptional regulator [Clostridiales bacterium]|nr:TetR/AcrR family transcriptional regulator [Clostridiales bacterium]
MKQSERTELTISRILNAATVEFGTNGYTGGTVNNICKTGIHKGLIYHNFKDKDELYLSCLKKSCEKLTEYIRAKHCSDDLMQYMNARMDFFREYPNEARIFFEALLNPQPHLRAEIKQAMQELEEQNERIYRKAIQSITLRDGVTTEDALLYFRQMQTMFNGYFSSPAYHNTDLDEKVKIHEASIPKLFDFMLYGIAKGDPAK